MPKEEVFVLSVKAVKLDYLVALNGFSNPLSYRSQKEGLAPATTNYDNERTTIKRWLIGDITTKRTSHWKNIKLHAMSQV